MVADHVSQVHVLEQVELGHLAARDLVYEHPVEFGEDRDVGEQLVRGPFAFAAPGRHPRTERSQSRGCFLEPAGQLLAVVVEHLVQELLDVGAGEGGALDLHRLTNLSENQAMCYSDAARVPLPPISGAAADQGDLVLTSSDGTRVAAYFARAEKPSGAGMVVMPDVRGLHQFYQELAQRFAEAVIDSVAIDYFGRTAGIGDRREAFEYIPPVGQTTQENNASDRAAASPKP